MHRLYNVVSVMLVETVHAPSLLLDDDFLRRAVQGDKI